MTIRPLTELGRDTQGRGMFKFTFAACALAMAGAATSPAFEANPLIGGTVAKFRHQLPETLQTVTNALRGQ